jgi:DNA-binding transcriptional LysR family regulator
VRQAGISPRGQLDVDNIDAAKRMVEQRLGIALLPQTSVQAEVGTGRLVPVTITDMPPVRRQIVVARRRDAGEVSPVLAAFLATLDDLRPSEERSHRFLA